MSSKATIQSIEANTQAESVTVSPDEGINNIRKASSLMEWHTRVPFIASSLGFSQQADSVLMEPEQVLPRKSPARRMGVHNLHDAITKSASEGGLAMAWDQWCLDVEAFIYRQEFGVSHKERDQVIREVSDVRQALSHEPVSLFEYNQAKTDIQGQYIDNLIQEHSEQVGQLNHQIKTLNDRIDKREQDYKVIFQDHARLRRELSEQRAHNEQLIEGIKSDNDGDQQHRIQSLEAENAALEVQAEGLRKSANETPPASISAPGELDQGADSQIQSLQEQIAQLQAELDLERQLIGDDHPEQGSGEIEALKETNANLEYALQSRQNRVDELDQEMQTLRYQYVEVSDKAEKLEDRLSKKSKHIKALNTRKKEHEKTAKELEKTAKEAGTTRNWAMGLLCVSLITLISMTVMCFG